MAWTSVAAQGSFSDSALTGASRFTDASLSSTTSRNFSRFLAYDPASSSLLSTGIDFSLTFNDHAPFVLLSTTSLAFLASADSRY